GAVGVGVGDEGGGPEPPNKVALREATRGGYGGGQGARVMVLPAAVLSSPVRHRLGHGHRVGLTGVEPGDHVGEAGNFDNCCLWCIGSDRRRHGRGAWDSELYFWPVAVVVLAQILCLCPTH